MSDAAAKKSSDPQLEAILEEARRLLPILANVTATPAANCDSPEKADSVPAAFDLNADMPFEASEEYSRHRDLPTLWRQGLRRRSLVDAPSDPVLDIPLSRISTAELDNVRSVEDEAQFRGLMASMESAGLINPITVVAEAKRQGHYVVICGFRRFRAACELGWNSIKASLRTISTQAEAYLLNLLENTSRATITTHDLAARCELLVRHFRIPVSELSKQLGYSPSHVHNLVRLLGALPKSILDDWKNAHPLLSIARLDRLSQDTLGAEGKWQTMRRAFARDEFKRPPTLEEQFADLEDAEISAAHDPTGWQPFKRPSKAAIIRVRDIIARQKLPEDPQQFRALALGLCDFFRGVTASVPGVLTPPLKKRRRPAGAAFAGRSRTS